MLFASWEVRIVKNCDRGLQNAARDRSRPRAVFSCPRSQFFTIRTDPKPVNNLVIFFLSLSNENKTHGKKLTQALLWPANPDLAKNQSDCRIRDRVRLEKNIILLSIFSAFWTELCSTNTNQRYQRKDDLHLIWYRLHSVAGARFHHSFLVLQTGAS